MHPMLNTAVKAALSAGKMITRSFERLEAKDIERKGAYDYVTKVDKAAELEIVELLSKSYPDHAILAEETGGNMNAEYTWIIDPLDGTLNYIHGNPHFCVSIALLHKQRVTQAVIYDPIQQELFTASRGKGAQLNNRRLRVSQQTLTEEPLLACPFPVIKPENADVQLPIINNLHKNSTALRQPGAAALELAYVAAGRFDAFWDHELRIWDIAAGSLLVEESGGLVSDWQGNPNFLQEDTGSVLAANPKMFKQLLPLVQKAYA